MIHIQNKVHKKLEILTISLRFRLRQGQNQAWILKRIKQNVWIRKITPNHRFYADLTLYLLSSS
jgi:hypothetical protein